MAELLKSYILEMCYQKAAKQMKNVRLMVRELIPVFMLLHIVGWYVCVCVDTGCINVSVYGETKVTLRRNKSGHFFLFFGKLNSH